MTISLPDPQTFYNNNRAATYAGFAYGLGVTLPLPLIGPIMEGAPGTAIVTLAMPIGAVAGYMDGHQLGFKQLAMDMFAGAVGGTVGVTIGRIPGTLLMTSLPLP